MKLYVEKNKIKAEFTREEFFSILEAYESATTLSDDDMKQHEIMDEFADSYSYFIDM